MPTSYDADANGALTGAVPTPRLALDDALASEIEDALTGTPIEDFPDAAPERQMVVPHDFTGFYVRHRTSFEVLARRFLTDRRDVDEVVQEALFRLFLAMPEVETERQALAFCRRTVTNLCIDRYRADKRRPRLVSLVDGEGSDVCDLTTLDDPVLRAEDAAVVREALSLLSPLHRAALVKREIEEKPLATIAAELGVAEDGIKHLLFRARRSLRRLLVGTSVDPDCELSTRQLVALTNRRLAHSTLGAGHAIVFVLMSGLAALALLRGAGQSPLTAGGSVPLLGGSPPTPTTSYPAAPVPATAAGPAHRAAHHHGQHPSAGATEAVAHHSPPATRTSISHPSPGSRQPSVGIPSNSPAPGPSTGGHGSPPPPMSGYAMTGALKTIGPAGVTNMSATVKSSGEAVGSSLFVAPTELGTFTLQQTVTQGALQGAVSVAVRPTVQSDNGVTTVDLGPTSTTVSQASDGTLIADVHATVQPGGSTVGDVAGLDAHIVIASDLAHVLSEQVITTAQANCAPTSSTVACGNSAPAAPSPSTAPGVVETFPTNPGDQPRASASLSTGGTPSLLPKSND